MFVTSEGKYLFWYHHHGGTSWSGRNPASSGGVLNAEGVIQWSEPELVLFDPNPAIRMSYPDLIEQGGPFLADRDAKNRRALCMRSTALLTDSGIRRRPRAFARTVCC